MLSSHTISTTDTFLKRTFMIASISYSCPDQKFWSEYTELWANSIYRPVFKSPHYVQFLAKKYEGSVAIYRFYREGKLKGASFFVRDGSEYRMMTDIKADHNFFVLHKDLTQEDIVNFIRGLLAEIKKEHWALSMHVQPAWASYMGTFEKMASTSGLFFDIAQHSVCPILEEATAKDLYDKLNSSRELRYRVSRIKSQLNGEFEILTGDEDLDNWVRKFCRLHQKRWEDSGTPSRYADEQSQQFLKNCLQAWADDKTLVRFSVKVGGERIAFVICLLQQNRIIHHSTAYDDEYYKYSPGKALILTIGQWMLDHGLNILDFGEGAESYKYAYTNKELTLNQISISSYANLPFILKVKIRKTLRQKIVKNPGLKKFYNEKIRPLTQKVKA